MCLNKNSFNLLLISFVFYIRNSLEKQTKNSGVLLNCLVILFQLPHELTRKHMKKMDVKRKIL